MRLDTSGFGTSRRFLATQQFNRFRSEADIAGRTDRTGLMSTRPLAVR
jgi:hypothetical protein